MAEHSNRPQSDDEFCVDVTTADFGVQPPNDPPRKKQRWSVLFCVAFGAAGLGYAVWANVSGSPEPDVRRSSAPGWHALGACSFASSVEASRTLALREDGVAELFDSNKDSAIGTWTFDQAAEVYRTSIAGRAHAYRLIAVGEWVCMLISGDLTSANLTESWFAMESPTKKRDERQRD